MSLIRAAMRSRRRVPAGERVLPRTSCPAISASRARRCGSCRSGSTWTATRRVRAPRKPAVHDRLSRADRAGERPARAVRGLPRAARTHAGRTGRAWSPPATCRRSTSPTSTRSAARCANGDSSEEFEYRGEVDRAQKTAFLQTLDVFSVPTTYDEPKGLFLLEAGQRRAGRAAAPRRVSRDGVEDRRRPDRRAGRSVGARRRLPGALAQSRPRRGAGARRRGRRARALRRRTAWPRPPSAPTSRSAAAH